MTDAAGSPPAESKRRPGRRGKIVLSALVLAGLAATWQQGLLEDGLNELRRYEAAAAQPPTDDGSTTVQAFDFDGIPITPSSSESAESDTASINTDDDVDVALPEPFDPWTSPTLSSIDLNRLATAVSTIDTEAVCPASDVPEALDEYAEVLRIADGCILVEYELLRGRTLLEVRGDLSDDPSVHAVGLPPQPAVPDVQSPYFSDPRASEQWHLETLGAAELWQGWPSRSRVTVAVIDSGVDAAHTDLHRKIISTGHECHREPGEDSHGTHVSGIIAARQGNNFGVAGVAPHASILPLKIHFSDDYEDGKPIDPDCHNLTPSITVAISQAVQSGVDIINMSLGWEGTIDPSGQDPAEAAIRAAMMDGIMVVASAGNCGKKGWWIIGSILRALDVYCDVTSRRQLPAMYPGIIAVASMNESGERSAFSTSNEDVDIAAPGQEILSTVVKDRFESWDGTSMAAPVVSAVLAHLVARFPTADPALIVSSLYVTAENPDGEIRTDGFGHGIIRPLEAVRWLEANIGKIQEIDFGEIEESTGETPVILIADTSGSMGDAVSGEAKLESAKRLMLEFLSTVSPTREIALRTYPSLSGHDCSDGELRIGFSSRAPEMDAVIRTLHAEGDTPTAEALRAAVGDIRDAGFSQAEIALFSDGLYTCVDPCQVADEIVASGIDIRVHIGAFVESDEGRSNLECIARRTEGSYMEGSDVEGAFAAELGEFLERNSRPRLKVTMEIPESVAPSTIPSRSQQVEVVVRNDSNVAARDVVVALETEHGTEPTRRPVSVGNVPPGNEVIVSWELQPGFARVGADLSLDAIATAANTEEVVSSAGSVAVENPNVADKAGPILGVGQIVVMGDQLLSGVATSTRGPYGGCRRSREIGLLEVFGQPAERSLACANALMTHLAAPDWAKNVDSQISQLADLMEGEGAISAVVLSIGATDFGLSELARECVMSAVPCDSMISGVPTDEWMGESIAGGGPRHAAASTELVRALGTLDEALNEARDRSRGVRQIPILLLAQPRAFPFVHGACFERWQGEDLPLMTQPELNLYHHFVSVVNGTLEAAAVASQDLGLPVFYVDTTESAYLPDHTACSAEPYVQSLEPLAEAGSGVIKTLSEGGIVAVAGVELNGDTLIELGEEFLAPNEYGEQALANAVLRWSQSDEAQEADDFVSDEFRRRSTGIAPRVSEPTPGETRPFSRSGRPAAEFGRGWTASTSGFLPGALVTASVVPGERVVASAVADEDGTAELYVAVPRDIAPGDVTLVARGLSRSGEATSVEQPARVLPPLRPIHSVALPALAVLLLLSSVGLWRMSRRKATQSTPLQEENP